MRTKMKKSIIALSALLAACGGSSSDGTNDKTVSIKGKAIDGYIIGASVYLDLNFNNQLDSNEPNAITKEEGEFDLTVPSQYSKCAKYVPVVVDVPVGAIDTDYPDTPIEDAYSMVFPPQFALSTDQDLLNLTPLTSVVWSQVEKELQGDGQELSCESMLAEQSLREDISQRLLEQEWRVANRYNVTVNELYSDYVESGDAALHSLAQDIVPGLKISYTETKLLIDENPNADFAWVEYFLGKWVSDNNYTESWYRRQMVQTSNGNFVSETHEMSDDLNTKQDLLNKFKMVTTQRNDVNIEQTVGVEKSDTGYACALDEWLETIQERSAGIRNTVYVTTHDWSECENINGSDVEPESVTQSLVTKYYKGAELKSYSEHVYHQGNDSGYRDLINITNTISQAHLMSIGQKVSMNFYNEETLGADFWSRTKNEFSDDPSLPSQIMTSHNSDEKWERLTNYRNGTHQLECGDSEYNMYVTPEATCN